MKIDHVTIAGSNLKELEVEFEILGMKTDYGGPHSNGVTHMSLLGFDDGSYVELISVMKPGQPSPVWPKHIAEDGGPVAWAIQVDDIAKEVEKIRKLGISATGPEDYDRKRPDGVLVEWQLGFIGDKPPGATFPFLIKDKTPREYRVKPSMSVSQKGKSDGPKLKGLEKVVLGVNDLEKEIGLFQKVYGWGKPKRSGDALEGVIVAEFENTPVALVSPKSDNGWLTKRLAQFGESPCTFLVGTSDIQQAEKMYGLVDEQDWFGNRVAWIRKAKLHGSTLGFIQL
jgi:hypothetical protein